MAGVYIEVDDAEVLFALQSLQALVSDLHPALNDIGEYLLRSHDQRFHEQVDPDGNPWPDTSDVTKANKTRNIDKVLIESGDLMTMLRYQIEGNDDLVLGTDRKYGAMMQFGGTKAEFPHLWGDIPGRKFLGDSADDDRELLTILNRHIEAVWR